MWTLCLRFILGPYMEYKIYVQAFTWKNNGNVSDFIYQKTDIVAPSPPEIVNLTCQPEEKLFLRWKRPAEYYNSIDLYVISYRTQEQNKFQDISIKPLPRHIETSVRVVGLSFLLLLFVDSVRGKVCAAICVHICIIYRLCLLMLVTVEPRICSWK